MNPKPRQALIGVGANVGDRWAQIRKGVDRLTASPGVVRLEMSAPFETEPVGGIDQPAFLNLILGVETTLSPEALLALLLDTERLLGRDRCREVRWGPRVLDLDLLVFEGEERTSEALVLPHPRMAERSFVLIPLRSLLETSEVFSTGRWPRLAALARANPEDPGVRRWAPPSA